MVRGDQVVYLKGYGIVGLEGRAAIPQTPLIIGSSSKSFTALAVMQNDIVSFQYGIKNLSLVGDQ